MGGIDITVHGYRSTFDDWAHETTADPNHIIEQALAHAIPSVVEAARWRDDLFEKRRALKDDWSAHLGASDVATTTAYEPPEEGFLI
jgi:integrase